MQAVMFQVDRAYTCTADTVRPTGDGALCSGSGTLVKQDDMWNVISITQNLGETWIAKFHRPIPVPTL